MSYCMFTNEYHFYIAVKDIKLKNCYILDANCHTVLNTVHADKQFNTVTKIMCIIIFSNTELTEHHFMAFSIKSLIPNSIKVRSVFFYGNRICTLHKFPIETLIYIQYVDWTELDSLKFIYHQFNIIKEISNTNWKCFAPKKMGFKK
jgi:hypothetical protein